MTKRVGRKRKRGNTNDDDVKRWSDLPNELLELIKKRLSYIDQCKLNAVCKSWNSIEDEEEKRNIIIPPLQQMPWLLVFDETESCKLIDSISKKEYSIDVKAIKKKMSISNFHDMRVHESKYGWLLASFLNRKTKIKTLSFYSPFFDDENNNNFIELPAMDYYICLASFTSNPLDDDCTVVILNTVSSNTVLVHTCVRGQSEWSKKVFNNEFRHWDYVKVWMYSEGMFYYTTHSGKVGTLDLAREEWSDFPSSPLRERNLSVGTLYMVKSNDKELFLISEESLRKRNERWVCSRHHICRLDLSSMVWENLSSIGDCVLFIGNGYNRVLKSSVLKLNGERKEISDTIYYCSGQQLKYCSVHDFTNKIPNHQYDFSRRKSCARHYGPIATRKLCKKLLIDPPPSSSFSSPRRASNNSW